VVRPQTDVLFLLFLEVLDGNLKCVVLKIKSFFSVLWSRAKVFDGWLSKLELFAVFRGFLCDEF